jgi:hypothetical protein
VNRLALPLLASLAALACAAGAAREAPVAASVALPPPAAGAPERLALVTIHGLAPDDYLARGAVPRMPTLAALALSGVAAEAVAPVFPASAYPAHATLVTGVTPARHGIGAEQRLARGQGITGERVDHADDVGATALWEVVAAQGRGVAALDWPSTGGAPIADLAPDLVLAPGESWVEAVARTGAGRAAELARRAGGADARTAAPGPERDAVLVTMACALLVGDAAPGLTLLRLSQPAGAQADAELARLVRCLDDAGLLATTALAVAGDHGLAPVHTEIRPNVALADAGLLVPASGGAVQSWDAIARSSGGSAFVYASDDDAALLARRALEALANESGLFRVLSAQEMVARGADPEAWFGLEAAVGYVFGNAAAGEAIVPSSQTSAGGYGAGEPRMTTGFVAWGPALRAGLRVPAMRQIDVAPTLAYWLGARLDDARGSAMIGLFRGGR